MVWERKEEEEYKEEYERGRCRKYTYLPTDRHTYEGAAACIMEGCRATVVKRRRRPAALYFVFMVLLWVCMYVCIYVCS